MSGSNTVYLCPPYYVLQYIVQALPPRLKGARYTKNFLSASLSLESLRQNSSCSNLLSGG